MKLETTLQSRLVKLVLAAIVPLFGLSIVGAVLTASEAVGRVKQNLAFSASLVAANQAQLAESARQVLTAIANTPELMAVNSPLCHQPFKSLNDKLPMYANLGVIDVDGILRCHARGAGLQAPVFVGDRAYFREAMASRTFVTSGYLGGRASKVPVMTFSLPLSAPDQTVRAVAFAAVRLSALSSGVTHAPLPTGSRLLVMDREGVVLAAQPENAAQIGQPVTDSALRAAISTGVTSLFEGPDASGDTQIYAFRPSGQPGESSFFVAVSADKSEVLAPARKRLLLVFLVLSLVALFGSWLAWRIGGRTIVRPAADILEAAKQIQNGRMDVRVPPQGGGASTEITRIAISFNRMADALEQRERELAEQLANSRQANTALELLQLAQARSYAKLCETQRKLLEAQRLGRIGHWEINLQTGVLTCPDEFHNLFGVRPGTFNGNYETFLRMVHPDDRADYDRRRLAAQADAAEFDIEYRIITPQGDTRWLHQLGRVHLDGTGRPVSRAGVVQEITARKQFELALERSAEQLRRTSEMAQVGGWEVRFDTLATEWSDELCRIHELSPAHCMGAMQAMHLYAPEARRPFRKALRAAVRQAQLWDLELPMRTANGRRIWVRTQGRPVMDGHKVVGLTGAHQDITLQHESREQLRLLETAISRLNDIVLITAAATIADPGPRIVFVNDAFKLRTGYSREDVIGKSPRLLQGPETQRSELERIRVAMENLQPIRSELINYTKAGEAYWVELDMVPIADDSGKLTHWVAVERDITQRKLAEQALGESEQRYAALFEMGPVPMWVYDVGTLRFLTVNQAAVQGYGYSVTEFLSMTILDICSATEVAAEHLKKPQILGPCVARDRLEHRRKDGTLFMTRAFSEPVPYAGTSACFVVALDISPQVSAESDVREHLFSLQRAADATQAITWHQTVEGMLQEVADQARGVIGAHQAAINLPLGGDWTQAVRAVSVSGQYAAYRDVIEPLDGTEIDAQVYAKKRAVRMTQADLDVRQSGRNLDANGHNQPAARGWLAVPLLGRSGQNIGLLQLSGKYEGEFTLQDEYVATELAQLAAIALENARLLEEVSTLNTGLERKVAERTLALSRQEALFRALAEQAPQVVWTTTPVGLVTYLNRAWFDLAGGALNDWTGVKWYSKIHPDDLAEVRSNWSVAMAHQTPYVGIRRVLARDGSYHTMSYRASPVLDDKGDVAFWVGIDADISEVKAIEAALRLSNQELEAFSYSVSHDLRSPLNTIDGFSRLLSKQLSADMSPKAQHYLSRIQVGVAQMGKLIEDLLSLAQVSRMSLRLEQVNLSALSQDILNELRARDPERQATLSVQEGLWVHGDGRLVRVMMDNLLGNAWKFTSQKPNAGIRVGKKIDAAGVPVFFVSDDGAGFDMAYADKLFVAFQRLHTVAEFPGTGIGLATVSRVVARYGGRLWAEAAADKGATFFFTLPMTPTAT